MAWDGLRAFERDQRRRGLAPNTIKTRDYTLRRFAFWLAPLPLIDASAEHVERWLDAQPLRSKRARVTYTAQLRSFYEFASRVGMVEQNPTAELGRIRVGRLLPNPCTDDELRAALAAAPLGSREFAWVTLAAFDGLRTCEMARLAREDVRDREETPTIFVHGKGEADRVVPLHPNVAAALHSYGLPGRGIVFTMTDGRPLREKTLNRYFNLWLHHVAGVDASAHQLRHWFGTNFNRECGGDLRLTQEMMGHQDPGSTAGYTAWDQRKASEVVRRLSLNGHGHLTTDANEAPAEAGARWEEP